VVCREHRCDSVQCILQFQDALGCRHGCCQDSIGSIGMCCRAGEVCSDTIEGRRCLPTTSPLVP
jgi:hypothetical protein